MMMQFCIVVFAIPDHDVSRTQRLAHHVELPAAQEVQVQFVARREEAVQHDDDRAPAN